MDALIEVTENGYTLSALVERDPLDSERVTCALFAGKSCRAVGDGQDGFAAIEDAFWDALAERARIAQLALTKHARFVAALGGR